MLSTLEQIVIELDSWCLVLRFHLTLSPPQGLEVLRENAEGHTASGGSGLWLLSSLALSDHPVSTLAIEIPPLAVLCRYMMLC